MLNKEKTDKFIMGVRDYKRVLYPIKNIKKVGKRKVIDITVEGEYFLCSGTITHNSTYRIYLRKGRKGTRVAKLVDAPSLPDDEANFMITEGGVTDV